MTLTLIAWLGEGYRIGGGGGGGGFFWGDHMVFREGRGVL